MVDYYNILGIQKSAGAAELKSAYKKMAKLYHPDKNRGDKAKEERFKLINEAYQTLSDNAKRVIYDHKLDFFLYQQRLKQTAANQAPPHVDASNPYSTSYRTRPDMSEDPSQQGRHYSPPSPRKKERVSDHYILGVTLFIIIAVGCVLLGLLMNHVSAKECYKTALKKYQAEDYNHALMDLNKAIEFDEKYADAYRLRGDIKMVQQRYALALPDYNYAIMYSETVSPALEALRDSCRKMAQQEAAE